jgi:predicted nucleic acid-binding protein
VTGVRVHDARLVAVMQAHAIERILTFDAGDFAGFPIEVLMPEAA